MEEKELRTSTKQRIIIGAIAVIMVGSMIASYAAIIMNGSKSSADSSETSKLDPAVVAEYQKAYDEEVESFKKVSASDYEKFSAYKSEIKAYNENTANSEGVTSRDLLKGDGRKLTEEDTDYLAYYVGWCADESIFDSSYDDTDNPNGFAKVLDVSQGMIEGWYKGVAGMHLNGIREITVPGELAYGDKMEICGGKNKPLKFIILAVEDKEPLKSAADAVDTAFMKLQYANYGIDYDKQMQQSQSTEASEGTAGAPAESE